MARNIAVNRDKNKADDFMLLRYSKVI